MTDRQTDQIIDSITRVFADHGDEEYLGEPVTMSEHMLQTAHFAGGWRG